MNKYKDTTYNILPVAHVGINVKIAITISTKLLLDMGINVKITNILSAAEHGANC